MGTCNKTYVCLLALCAAALVAPGQGMSQPGADAPAAEQQAAVGTLKGKVKTVVNKNRTISLTVEGRGLVVVTYTDETKLVNAASFKDVHPDELLTVEYKTVGAENVATTLAKVVAALPSGSSAMKLDEVRDLVARGPEAGAYTLFDSRPASRYHEGHIPTAQSLPFAEMEKADKEGKLAELLPKEKDRVLIFYCGGVT